VLFTEARDLLAQVIAEVASARSAIAVQMNARTAALRQEQALLAGAAVLGWALVALILVPVVRTTVRKSAEWRQDLAEAIKKPHVSDEMSGIVRSAAPASAFPPPAPPAPSEPMLPVAAVEAAAEVCSALSAMSDPEALARALSRASDIIEAKGLIVWVASSDGASLAPVALHGYDERVLTRIGRVASDSSNLTAAAFRDSGPKTSGATDSTPAALAAPLRGPAGSVGVLSAELRPGLDADASRVALASIVAAQLATLVSPTLAPPVASETMEPRRVAL
jgi:hypothetical protein